MDKETKERLREIRAAMKKYGFDKILGETAKSKIHKKMMMMNHLVFYWMMKFLLN